MNANAAISAKKAILVLGMHRSGTSLVTRLVSLLGADLPSHLLHPNEGNVTGYWESEDIVRLHDELLAHLGMAWDQPFSLSDNWRQTEEVLRFQQKIIAVLQTDFEHSGTFVLKDPRVSLLVPLWEDILRNFNAEPSFVICIRNPLDIAASLQKRNQFSLQKTLVLWASYLLNAERWTRGKNRCFIGYEDLLQNWQAEIPRLISITGNHSNLAAPAQTTIGQTISREYCHQLSSLEAFLENRSAPTWAKDLYQALKRAHAGDENTAAFDSLYADLQDLIGAFAPLLREHHQATWRAWHLGEQIKQLNVAHQEEIESLKREERTRLDHALSEIAQQKREVHRIMEDLVAYRSTIGRLEAEIATLRAARKEHDPAIETAPSSCAPRLDASTGSAPHAIANGKSVAEIAPVPGPQSPRLLSGIVQQLRSVRLQLGSPFLTTEGQKTLIENSGLFDQQYYREQLGNAPIDDCIAHYLATGDALFINPHWLFSTFYYREMNAVPSDQNTLVHYLTSRDSNFPSPHPMFDSRFYLQMNPDVAAAGINPLVHFLRHGWKEGRPPNRLFDLRYYLDTYPDVAAASVNPVEHYILHGQFEDRNPSALFQTASYRRFHPKLATMKIDPLSHYLWRGIIEGESALVVAACECA